MNNRDRNLMERFTIIFDSIPAGQAGKSGPTISIKGIITAHDDLVQARAAFRLFAQALADPDSDDDPKDVVNAFEKWVKSRRLNDWSPPVYNFRDYFYSKDWLYE